jgi:hypothetical protein
MWCRLAPATQGSTRAAQRGLERFGPGLSLGAKVGSADGYVLLMTEVVLAQLRVWIWPGETPRVGTLIGGAIVLTAVVWLVLTLTDQDVLLVS